MICLVPHCGYMSSTTRVIEIYRELAKRKLPVVVATHGGTYEPLLERNGVDYVQIGPRMSAERCARFLRSQVGNGPRGQSMYSDQELRDYVAAEAALFSQREIDVVFTGWTLTTLLSTRLAGVKLVTEHAGSFVPPVFERGLLPVPLRRSSRLRLLPRRLATRILNAAPPRVDYYCSGFNRLAAELGVAPVPSLAALVLGDLSLVPEAPSVLGISEQEMESWRPAGRKGYRAETRLRYSGPLYARLGGDLPPEVDAFLEGPESCIYVAINSTTAEFVRAVVRRLRELGVKLLVVSTVHDLDDLVDERVMIRPILPSHRVMPRVRLAVTAGGQGSVQTAMAAGVPVLGFPIQPEQDLNLVLVERLGAGRRVALRKARSPAIAALARELIDDPSYRDAARRIQADYARIDGPARAVDAIAELLARGSD